MITKMKLMRFQAHEKTTITFTPGINVIVGPSDVGKSSIIRALFWCLRNKPRGDAVRMHGATAPTRVALYFDDAPMVRRSRGSDVNDYKVGDETLTGFGNEIPDKVLMTSRIDSSNFQLQMDAPFLLSAAPAEVARMLSGVAGLHKIDSTVSAANTSMKRARRDAQLIEGMRAEVEEELGRVDFNLIGKAGKLKKLTARLERTEADCEALEAAAENLRRARLTADRLEKTASIAAAMDKVEQLAEELQRAEDERMQLRNAQRAYMGALSRANTEPQVSALRASLDRLGKLSLQFEKEYAELRDLVHAAKSVIDANSAIANAEEALTKAKKALHTSVPEVCPTCGQSTARMFLDESEH